MTNLSVMSASSSTSWSYVSSASSRPSRYSLIQQGRSTQARFHITEDPASEALLVAARRLEDEVSWDDVRAQLGL